MRLNRFYSTAICFAICLSVCGFLASWWQSTEAHQVFGNMTYMTDCPYIVKKVKLVNGYRQARRGLLHYSMSYDRKYFYGDFNRDGLKDAVVVIGQGEGHGWGTWLAFLVYDGKKYVHTKSGFLSRTAIINSLKVKGSRVIVDMFVLQADDCNAGPTGHVIGIFDTRRRECWMDAKRISAKSIFDPAILMLKEPSFLLDLPSWDYVLRRCKI